ncbi:MAG: ABC transporter permease [Tannerella sp.]|jgi:ABC-type antimicrobial peptide transport system permease subunit|nr:ABC transporter permease [Tannerella sp.]
MFTTYIKTAWRYLTRNRTSSVINILGLSLGITACLLIFLITRHELSFDTFHPDKERIYRLTSERVMGDNTYLSAGMLNPVLEPIREEIAGPETVAIFYNVDAKVRIASPEGEKYFEAPRMGIEPVDIIVTDPAYFEIFQYEWLAGSPAALDQPFRVALTDDKARKYFGDLPADEYIGKEITYGDSLFVTVAGVVKSWKKKTDLIFNDFISYASIPGSELRNQIDMKAWGMWDSRVQVYMKLHRDISPSVVEDRLTAWGEKRIQLMPETTLRFILQPLSNIHFNSALTNEDVYSRQVHLPTLYGLMAIAAFILIIAACNFINLSTAQSLQRTKEIGIRKVLGGKRANLIAQLLGETLLVTSFAAILALLLAGPLIDLFRSFVPQGLSLGLNQPFTWLFLLTVILCTTLLAGVYPAGLLSRASPVAIIKGGGQRGSSKSLLRKSLIVFQFTISLVLIICTLVVGDQIHYLMNKDLGYDNKQAIINIRINRIGNSRTVLAEKIKQLPYVESVSIHTVPPSHTFHNGTRFTYNVNGEDREISGSIEFCDDNFIPLYGIRMVAGRSLLPSPYMKEVVVNESFARQLGFDNPQDAIGELIQSGQMDSHPDMDPDASSARKLQIVGIASDFHLLPLYNRITPMVISATAQAGRTLSVKLVGAGKNSASMKQVVADLEKTWKELNPYERLEMTFYDDAIASFYEKEQQTAQIISAAMFTAILISCMGLFGLVIFTTKQRTKEIGIRKVLGANVGQILTLLSGGFVRLILIASLIASPIAWFAMNKWLDGFAYRVPVHGWIFVVACLLALIIALATISLQTIKVARANPARAISE